MMRSALPLGLRSVGPRLADGDPEPLAPRSPAALEAGAVVDEHALDPDPVLPVEALASRWEGEHRVGRVVRVGRAKPSRVLSSIAAER
jgi:hypothetical protein